MCSVVVGLARRRPAPLRGEPLPPPARLGPRPPGRRQGAHALERRRGARRRGRRPPRRESEHPAPPAPLRALRAAVLRLGGRGDDTAAPHDVVPPLLRAGRRTPAPLPRLHGPPHDQGLRLLRAVHRGLGRRPRRVHQLDRPPRFFFSTGVSLAAGRARRRRRAPRSSSRSSRSTWRRSTSSSTSSS